MQISRVQIRNFRNFQDLDVALDRNVVLIGENRVGKSNFLFALRLVLDPALPDSARQLKISDFWDGALLRRADPQPGNGAERNEASLPENLAAEIHVDFAGFEDNDYFLALLTDYRLPEDHTTARLTYVFRKKDDLIGAPASEADFEFRVFGGGDETRSIKPQLRRRIALDVLGALRDAESDLGSWRNSPLRPLLDDAISRVSEAEITEVARRINEATARMAGLEPIRELERELRGDIATLAGPRHDIRAKLAFTTTDPHRVFRSIRLFIDDGERAIGDASLGSANLALLSLKLAEFEWRRQKNERNFTLLAVEEPEAHLHPHLQRKVFGTLLSASDEAARSLIVTTHSPNIASVAPLRALVLLSDRGESGTKGHSVARLPLSEEEMEDLQRYLTTTRAEILFSRGVVCVEGDAEAFLVPVFAKRLGYDLDAAGVTICNVSGTNFAPYVRLAAALGLPCSVITDWDPREHGLAYGWARSLELVQSIRTVLGADLVATPADESELRGIAAEHGIFLNSTTLEVELSRDPSLVQAILGVLSEEDFGPTLKARLLSWKDAPATIDAAQLLLMIGYVGKGRFAARLAPAIAPFAPPAYISLALKRVMDAIYG